MNPSDFWKNRNNQQEELYRLLELIDAEPHKAPVRERWLNAMGKRILDFFTASREPVVSENVDRSGQVCWTVYDPHTGQTTWFGTKYEVMVWLERYFSL